MSDQAKWTTLMVLDAAALDAGVNMQCHHRQLERVALAERISAQLRREGLLAAEVPDPPPVPIWIDHEDGPAPWITVPRVLAAISLLFLAVAVVAGAVAIL